MVQISLKLMDYLFRSESIITGWHVNHVCNETRNDETKNNFLNQDETKGIHGQVSFSVLLTNMAIMTAAHWLDLSTKNVYTILLLFVV